MSFIPKARCCRNFILWQSVYDKIAQLFHPALQAIDKATFEPLCLIETVVKIG